jgi:hypothetical protein
MKDARDTLGFNDKSDPFELNEMHIPKFNQFKFLTLNFIVN